MSGASTRSPSCPAGEPLASPILHPALPEGEDRLHALIGLSLAAMSGFGAGIAFTLLVL